MTQIRPHNGLIYVKNPVTGFWQPKPRYEQRTAICSVEDCESETYARGWCSKHYIRWRNHGTTDLPSRRNGHHKGGGKVRQKQLEEA